MFFQVVNDVPGKGIAYHIMLIAPVLVGISPAAAPIGIADYLCIVEAAFRVRQCLHFNQSFLALNKPEKPAQETVRHNNPGFARHGKSSVIIEEV